MTQEDAVRAVYQHALETRELPTNLRYVLMEITQLWLKAGPEANSYMRLIQSHNAILFKTMEAMKNGQV